MDDEQFQGGAMLSYHRSEGHLSFEIAMSSGEMSDIIVGLWMRLPEEERRSLIGHLIAHDQRGDQCQATIPQVIAFGEDARVVRQIDAQKYIDAEHRHD